MQVTSLVSFTAMTGIYVLGEFQLARFARSDDVTALVIAVLSFIAANALFVGFLRTSDYGVAMTVSALAVLVGHVLIGLSVMGDRYSGAQVTGLVLASLAIVLLCLPSAANGGQ